MSRTVFYNAHHSPMGAFASLTLGAKGANGGFGLELDRPACCSLFVGAESHTPGVFSALPFFGDSSGPKAEDFDLERGAEKSQFRISSWSDDLVTRRLTPCCDEWTVEDFTLRVLTPIRPIPEPGVGSEADLRDAIIPAVWMELTLDNRQGSIPRRIFFGQQGGDPSAGLRHAENPGLTGIWLGRRIGFFTRDERAVSGIGFGPQNVLAPNDPTDVSCMLGSCGMVTVEVPARQTYTLRLVGAFYHEGSATTGIKTSYLYSRFFSGLEEAAKEALDRFDAVVLEAEKSDRSFDRKEFNQQQRFMLAHALRSYYGSTQLLVTEDGKPLWNVNEGEYRMMNTFDLTVDHLFHELRMNPWVQRNVLDLYVSRYSYHDDLAGGRAIAFTHDMGVANHFSRPGWSSYERTNEEGCFSHMSHEELVNWVLCACMTMMQAPDAAWADRMQPVLMECLESLCLRDDPDPELRTGIMSVDSPRCGSKGAEITTYDSLDPSLGQSRASTYLGMKTLAAYALLTESLDQADRKAEAQSQALKALNTLTHSFNAEGILPSLLEGGDKKMIIPVIEGLVFFKESGLWARWMEEPSFEKLVSRLKDHLRLVLQPGRCLFPSGGWKLSASSSNSWLSKIYLCQHVARTCLGYGGMDSFTAADSVHESWLLDPESLFWAWSDQIVDGVARGSRYYPRGVTAILWLEE